MVMVGFARIDREAWLLSILDNACAASNFEFKQT